jgi:hypothetical protein
MRFVSKGTQILCILVFVLLTCDGKKRVTNKVKYDYYDCCNPSKAIFFADTNVSKKISESANISYIKGDEMTKEFNLQLEYFVLDQVPIMISHIVIYKKNSNKIKINQIDTVNDSLAIRQLRDSLFNLGIGTLKCIKGYSDIPSNREAIQVYYKNQYIENCFHFSDTKKALSNTHYGYIERLFNNHQYFKLTKNDIENKAVDSLILIK